MSCSLPAAKRRRTSRRLFMKRNSGAYSGAGSESDSDADSISLGSQDTESELDTETETDTEADEWETDSDEGDDEDGDDGDESDDEAAEDMSVGSGGKKGAERTVLQVAFDELKNKAKHDKIEKDKKKAKEAKEAKEPDYYTEEERAFIESLPAELRARVEATEKRMLELLPYDLGTDAAAPFAQAALRLPPPMRFKILLSNMDDAVKRLVLSKLERYQCMDESYGEAHKLGAWLDAVCRMPLGIYRTLPVTLGDGTPAVAEFLQRTRRSIDAAVYGHTETKNHLLRILAQWVANPSSCGHAIGIQGPPGIGKTSLVKHGIASNLGLPFAFVPLGGGSDAAFLEGHHFTYEGSTYGKVAECLLRTRCMNPVIFFDELDKVSSTPRGDEIMGSLIHLTDATQNDRVQDKYFGEVELDLSRALFVFSYNDESTIHPVLRDRLITIRVKGYDRADKRILARDFLWPEILKAHGFEAGDVVLCPAVVDRIVERVAQEEGVRHLKRGLETVASWINLLRFLPEPDRQPIEFPFVVTESFVDHYVKLSSNDGGDAMRSMFL